MNLSEKQRVLIGRAMAAVSVALAVFAVAVYVSLGAADEMYDDWVIHNSVGPVVIGGLFWLMVGSQPRNRVVWVFGWSGFFQALNAIGVAVVRWTLDDGASETLAGTARADADLWRAGAAILEGAAWLPGIAPLVTLALLWFPDGRPPSKRWRPVAVTSVAGIGLATAGLVWVFRWWGEGAYTGDEQTNLLMEIGLVITLVSAALSTAALIARFRTSTGVERRQFRWVAWTMGVVSVAWISTILYDALVSTAETFVFQPTSLATLPFLTGGYAVAIWRHQLFDIDVVISRTLLFGFLAAFIGAVYVAIVFGVGSLIGQTSDSNSLSLVATIVVAFGFQPVRRRAEHAANRLVYGKRATPYEVLSDLTSQLNQTETTAGLLDRMVERLADGAGADSAVLWRRRGDSFAPAATWPPAVEPPEQLPDDAVPIERSGLTLGALSITKPRGEDLNPTERRLIADLAGSAGLILDRARLDAELSEQARELASSRRRLLDAQDAERQRLRDELQRTTHTQLERLRFELDEASELARADGLADLAVQLETLTGDTDATLAEIDALAQGIYPPQLETEGLTAAIETLVRTIPFPTTLSASGVTRHHPDTETAVYFCITEAVTNAIKHANATNLHIHLLTTPDELTFTVTDDGDGFDPTSTNGHSTGISGITDRLHVIDGHLTVQSRPGSGTTITGTVPSRTGRTLEPMDAVR